MEIPRNIRDLLKEIGFTDYEIAIYVTLVTKGSLNAKELSSLSDVPYSRIYQIIQTLSDKKFIIKDEESRPTLYSATPPVDALKFARDQHFNEMDSRTKMLFDELNPIYLTKSIPQKLDVFQIEGQDHCLIKMEKMINKTQKSVGVITANLEVLESIYPVLEKLRLKGISDITLLIEGGKFEQEFKKFHLFKKYLKIAEIRRVPKIFGTLAVVDDGNESMFMFKKNFMDEEVHAGIFCDNPMLSSLSVSYFEHLAEGSGEFSSPKRRLTKIKLF